MQAFDTHRHAAGTGAFDVFLAVFQGQSDFMAEREVQFVGTFVSGTQILVFGQHIVVFLHLAFGFDMGDGLHRFGPGQIAGRRERDTAWKQRPGDHSQRPAAYATGSDGDHAARVTSKLTLHHGDIMFGGGLGKHFVRQTLGLFDNRHVHVTPVRLLTAADRPVAIGQSVVDCPVCLLRRHAATVSSSRPSRDPTDPPA